MKYWNAVHRQALSEARELAHLDNPGRALFRWGIWVAPVVLAGIVPLPIDGIQRVGVVIGAAIVMTFTVYVWKLLAIPPRLAAGVALEHEAALEALHQTVSSQAQELRALKAPPPPSARDPDAIYQWGKEVGRVHGANVSLGTATATFDAIHGTGDFNSEMDFEYRDYILKLVSNSTTATTGFGGVMQAKMYRQVQTQIVGKRP